LDLGISIHELGDGFLICLRTPLHLYLIKKSPQSFAVMRLSGPWREDQPLLSLKSGIDLNLPSEALKNQTLRQLAADTTFRSVMLSAAKHLGIIFRTDCAVKCGDSSLRSE